MAVADLYTEDEWRAIATKGPLADLDANEAYSLHRYWIWMNYQRSLHASLLHDNDTEVSEDPLRSRRSCAMYLWYSFLWSLIEGLQDRGVELSGAMKDDVEYLGDRLRRCRNAVFHVPKHGQWDNRLFEIMSSGDGPSSGPDLESVARVRRLTSGFGRLFLEEPGRRGLS